MKRLYNVETETYILISKHIQKGDITVCTNGCGLDENDNLATRPVGNLEAVLVVDPHPQAGQDYIGGETGLPIYVIGVREVGSSEPLTVWREGFVHHPEHYHLCTSAHASGFFPLGTYKRMMESIRTADDVVELKKMLNKFLDVYS